MNGFSRAAGIALLTVVSLNGCEEPNPFYLGAEPDVDASVPEGEDASTVEAGPALDAPFIDDEPDAAPLRPDGGSCSPEACKGDFGEAPCGAWACREETCVVSCPDCDDGDGDGFGLGSGCAGLDCDDADPRVRDDVASRACYQGPAGTRGQGACRAGVASCTQGVWSQCLGQVTPVAESCNGEDDDCNQQVDDAPALTCGLGLCANTTAACVNGDVGLCRPKTAAKTFDGCGEGDEDCDGLIDEDCASCVRVSGLGNDALADGHTMPFRTIGAAIAWADADPERPRQVCVAASPTCDAALAGALSRFTEGEGKSLIMRDGISVVGGYESSTWTLCARAAGSALPPNPPTLGLRTAEGVSFPATIQKGSVLAGFRIERLPGAKSSAAITVDGAKGVVLSNVSIEAGGKADVNVGIEVTNGGQAVILRSQVMAGPAHQRSIAVHVKDAAVQLLGNCAELDERGRCSSTCMGGEAGLSAGDADANEGESLAVSLEGATTALLSGNALCGGFAKDSAGVKVQGELRGVLIAGNFVHADRGSASAAGLWFEDCGGQSPWVVGNLNITAAAETDEAQLAAVAAVGDCHPRIESNGRLAATGTKGKLNASGVLCAARNGTSSRCQILRNGEIRGLEGSSAEITAGVRCLGGSCARVAGNQLILGGTAKRSVGVWLQGGDARVERNVIAGGCGKLQAVGLLADEANARIENNVIAGASCDEESSEQPVGVEVLVGDAGRGVDLHSNTILVAHESRDCSGRTVSWASRSMDRGGVAGLVRNNLIVHDTCQGVFFAELDTRSRPRVFENNLFHDPRNRPLYRAGDGTFLSLADVNRPSGGSLRRNNLTGDAAFVDGGENLRLRASSAAIDQGTKTGAPLWDLDGKPRGESPDIGAFER